MRFTRLVWLSALLVCAFVPVMAGSDNPAADGFDAAGSDPRAIEIADQVMDAMGGRENWDRVRCLGWEMFGRVHRWDKATGDYEMVEKDVRIIMNLGSDEGRVWRGADEVSGEEKTELLCRAHRIWINDSYWLLMPHKLKDSGVTLRYGGERTTQAGRPADVLVLTFKDVGVSPQNRYHVCVDKETRLVTEWSFFREAGDTEASFVRPWTDWQKYGGISIAVGRGWDEGKKITGITVAGERPAGWFSAR